MNAKSWIGKNCKFASTSYSDFLTGECKIVQSPEGFYLIVGTTEGDVTLTLTPEQKQQFGQVFDPLVSEENKQQSIQQIANEIIKTLPNANQLTYDVEEDGLVIYDIQTGNEVQRIPTEELQKRLG